MTIVSPSYFGGAAFTMRLKKVIEITGGSVEIVNGVAKLTGGNIGLQYYPIFDEAYRDHLTGRIVDHFYNREIGMETLDMFQLAMRRRMNEIMPFYNKLYESERIAYDPLSTVDLTVVTSGDTTQNTTATNESTSSNDSTNGSRSVSSETPQTMLKPDADYATGGVDVSSSGHVTGVGTDESTAEVATESTADSHTTGYQGVAAEIIMRYRESLLNIDLSIIRDLEDCFMQVWNTPNSYTKGYLF